MDNKFLTKDVTEYFLELYKDGPNWSGTPLLGGNTRFNKTVCGYLANLKKADLLYTFPDGENPKCTWVYFTEKGNAFFESLTGEKAYN